MRKLGAFVDIQNLFHGLVRTTGDPSARVDYVKLRDMFRDQIDEVDFTAYVMTPVEKLDMTDTSTVSPEDRTGFVDDSFVAFLKRLGFKVRRNFCHMRVQETDDARYVSYVRTSMAQAVFKDVRAAIDSCDIILLASGVGALLPTAKMVKEAGKELWVAAFIRSGDLHSEYRRIADRIITFDKALRWMGSPRKQKR